MATMELMEHMARMATMELMEHTMDMEPMELTANRATMEHMERMERTLDMEHKATMEPMEAMVTSRRARSSRCGRSSLTRTGTAASPSSPVCWRPNIRPTR